MSPESQDQQQIITAQRPRPPASTHGYPNSNSHTQEYVRPPPGVLFGRPLKECLKYGGMYIISTVDASGSLNVWGGYIPVVVGKCGRFLRENTTEAEGIFNVSGSNGRIPELQEVFETPPRYGKSLDWGQENYTTHDVAGVFRRYLTQMPEPVIPYNLYFPFRDAIADKPYDRGMVISTYKRLIYSMPHANQYLLLYVLHLLSVFARKSDRNLMTAHDLAAIFRPGLISYPTLGLQPSEHQLSQEVLEFLIEHQDSFMLDAPPPPFLPSTPSRSLTPPLTAHSAGASMSVSDDEGFDDDWHLLDRHLRSSTDRGSRTAGTAAAVGRGEVPPSATGRAIVSGSVPSLSCGRSRHTLCRVSQQPETDMPCFLLAQTDDHVIFPLLSLIL
ncbi:Rho GTPase activation protein [Russula brevipes]|nr:Rho GTPase activation protein [Russula brevipes]